MELPSALRLSTKMAKITGLLATIGAEPAAATECDSYVENLVSKHISWLLVGLEMQLCSDL